MIISGKEAFYIAENSLCVIGRRSGFMEFLSFSNAVTVIFEGLLSNFKYDTRRIFPFSNVTASVYLTADFAGDFNLLAARYSNYLKYLGAYMNIDGFSFKTDRKDLVFLNSLEDALTFTVNFVNQIKLL